MTASILTKSISIATTYNTGTVHLQQISNTSEDSIRHGPHHCFIDPPWSLYMASVGVMFPLIVNDPAFVPTMAMSDMPIKPDDPMFIPPIPLIPDIESAVEEAPMDIVEDAVAIPDIPDISIDVGVEVVEVVMLMLLMSIAVEYR
ncbi:hypothetical protein KC349_g714 [Hortaea werneckii]|nr:hypothetical protein KC349_g714 [Hortaea werneckii]